jgi:hypothetical protein
MRFLSGGANPDLDAIAMSEQIGLLNTPKIGYATARMALYPFFALDCGAYSKGVNHAQFDFARWERWTMKRLGQLKDAGIMDRLLFVVVPDAIDVSLNGYEVTSHPALTLERYRTWAPMVRAAGAPAALVIQPGMRPSEIPWDMVDYVFIGGDTAWKEDVNGAGRVVRYAQKLGKPVHVGRVNTQRRIEIMAGWNVDSIDGTKLTKGSDANLPQLRAWMAAAA